MYMCMCMCIYVRTCGSDDVTKHDLFGIIEIGLGDERHMITRSDAYNKQIKDQEIPYMHKLLMSDYNFRQLFWPSVQCSSEQSI